jgi:hypothetical protein
MKITNITSIPDELSCDITTATDNFYVKCDKTSILVHNSPAIFVGTDPADGEFFIAKKGLFAKEPKVYKSPAEIAADTSGDLAVKLTTAFNELKDMGITTIIQGDMMFTKSDLKKETIDGENYITFHPNTIVYAVPTDSDLGKSVMAANVGVVFHTTYNGPSLKELKSTAGVNLSNLKKKKTVWMQTADYRDVAGKATFTKADTKEITTLISNAGKIFSKIAGNVLRELEANPALAQKIEQFNNTKVRKGLVVVNTKKHVSDLISWFNERHQQELDKLKSEKGKARGKARQDDIMKFFSPANKKNLDLIYQFQNAIVEAKLMLMKKLSDVSDTKTFVKTTDGFKVTDQEGFVAIDHMAGNAVKLVDRLTFSHQNFSSEILKGWS